MCIAAPGEVVKIEGKKAMIKYPGNEVRQAFISGEKVKVGSFVLVQMGIIIQILSKSEAKISEKAWN
jgi:hydrogenase assembly chaperone HypC/HupF